MIPLHFKLSEELVVRAAVRNASRNQMYFVAFAVVVAILTSAFMLADDAIWAWDRIALQFGVTVAGSLVIAGVLLAFMRFVAFPFQARRNVRQQKALSKDMALSWTNRGFLLESGQSRTSTQFADLYGFRASDEIVLLYIADALYHVIPVATFAGQKQLEAFLQTIREAGVRHR